MSKGNRIDGDAGVLIDRSIRVTFRFAGRSYDGCAGDCIASALAASDRWLLSRSFKYHRPRALLTMSGDDANTLIQLPGDPNALADRALVSTGLEADGQNYRGHLDTDRGALIGWLARFLPVGFYYRAFFRPRGIWNWWARRFRSMTGLGKLDENFVCSGYDKQYLFCDVLVVGGGPAGLTAALAAAAAGRSVILVDENVRLGGSLNYQQPTEQGEQLRQDVAGSESIRVLCEATANGWYADNWVPVVQGRRLFKLRAQDVLLCTGATEQLAVFRNNDLPGVMMGSAAQRLIHLYGVRPGRRAVVLAGNDQAYEVAEDLLDAGVDVAAVIEMRAAAPVDGAAAQIAARGVRVMAGQAVYEARGKDHVQSVDVRQIIVAGQCAAHGESIDCDLLCMSVGFMPCYQLACQAGASLNYDDDSAAFEIVDLPEHLHLAGSVNGCWRADAVRADALAAVARIVDPQAPASVAVDDEPYPNLAWPIFAHPKGKEFVDFDEDLQIADILNAVADGYDHVQLVKRFSTCGMGPSQGRHSALPMARLVARATVKSVAQTGVTTARPPYAAERIAHCAGRSLSPARRSAMHFRHIELGARWLRVGNWYRPAWYGEDDRDQAIAAEVAQVRSGVALIDVSTLGGVDIRGPQAGEFLDRLYTMAFTKLAVGRSRYALMTNEAGVVIDDGVACRFAADHYYVTTTTGGAASVFRAMLKWQAQWRLDVDLANVSSAYCGVNLAGPRSRAVLQTLCDELDLSPDGFEYLAVREGRVAGIAARMLRVGFVGELGYEIHVPQHNGEALWDALMAAGAAHGIRPFGVEAQRVLRLEKGHVIVGQDTDAMSNPMELDMRWALSKSKPFYVGKRTLAELAHRGPARMLVGFAIHSATAPLPMESHLVIKAGEMAGRVTSACRSPTLGHIVGLAYVSVGDQPTPERIQIRCDGGVMVDADVVALPFYDPDGGRQAL